MNAEARPQLLTLLDDAALARRVIEVSTALAQVLQRPLEVIYVESAPALLAAALPFTQVLAEGGAQWHRLEPVDVELGYRAQAERLRTLTERITLRHAVHWSMRVVRGALPRAAFELHAQSDLVLVGTASPAPALAPPRRATARPVIVAVTDDGEAGQRSTQVGREAAQALGGTLVVRHAAAGHTSDTVTAARCDLLVLPRALATPAVLAALPQPALLVG